jgi:hypothetical protein
MALGLASPGIKIREVDLTRGGINNTVSLSAGIAAPFEKGPVNEVTTIANENELVSIFGKPSKNNYHYEYWYSASNFLSYGGSLKVVRCSGSNLNNSNAGVNVGASTSLLIENYEDYQTSHESATNFYWAAKNPGSWADGLKVCVIDNFADQTINGISTASIQVGYAVTQSLSGVIPGVGTTSNATGYLKGIVSGIGSSKIYVKVTNTVEGNTETFRDYTENGIYAFGTTSPLYFNGQTIGGIGATSFAVTRAGVGTFPATSINLGVSLDLLNVDATTFVDSQGGANISNSATTIYVSNSSGITTSKFLLIDSVDNKEIVQVTSVGVNNNIEVVRARYGTVAVEHEDGSTISILTSYQNNVTTSAGITSTSTSIAVSGIGSVSEGDYLVNSATGEIILVNTVSQSSTGTPTSIDDWYNTQNILDASQGDSSTISWRRDRKSNV